MSQLDLLPRPKSVTEGDGSFTLTADLGISGPADWAAVVRRLLTGGTGLDLLPDPNGRLKLIKDDSLPAEAYQLWVSTDGIPVTASDERGVNWAIQTLRQLLPPS